MIPERRKEISSRSQLEHIMEDIKSCPHQKENSGLDLSDTNLFGIDLTRKRERIRPSSSATPS